MKYINRYNYKLNFTKFSKEKINEIKFETKNIFILYLKFPRFKVGVNNHNRSKYLVDYLNFQFAKVNNYINQNSILKNCNIVIKTKNNVKERNKNYK